MWFYKFSLQILNEYELFFLHIWCLSQKYVWNNIHQHTNRRRFQFGQILGMNLNHFQIGFHFWFGAKCKSLLALKLLIKVSYIYIYIYIYSRFHVSFITLEKKINLNFIHYFFSKFPTSEWSFFNFELFKSPKLTRYMVLPIWPLMETTVINLTEFLTLLLIVYLAFELEFKI
jgi:hypothetical protein